MAEGLWPGYRHSTILFEISYSSTTLTLIRHSTYSDVVSRATRGLQVALDACYSRRPSPA